MRDITEAYMALSPGERHSLTIFKWRYALEATGLTRRQAEYCIFYKLAVLKRNMHILAYREGVYPL